MKRKTNWGYVLASFVFMAMLLLVLYFVAVVAGDIINRLLVQALQGLP